MTRIIIFLSVLFLTSCAFLRSPALIQYYTLKEVSSPCMGEITVSGRSLIMSDKIVVKRGDHLIGAVPSSYWIAPLKSQLEEVLLNRGEKSNSLVLEITKFYFNADSGKVLFEGNARVCKGGECEVRYITEETEAESNDPLDIVKGYQKTVQTVSDSVCR